jgi:hypothetical protein
VGNESEKGIFSNWIRKSLKYPFILKAAQNRGNSEAFTAVTFQNKPVSSIE